MKCIILARNMDSEVMTEVPLFYHLREECMNRDIPLVHASTKRLLSRALEKFPYTNFVGLFFFQGFEDIYRNMIQLWKTSDSYKLYHMDQKSLFA
ncbi:hypothetical protein OESDEN_18566 [Oesophagostomum dentatum]|uniref:Ribosomal protein L7Ae/L30e/S12e/Gadd45 domain-containing protein n=1 Tax=Oesophagostomum dentatum TaxID=61180 RepID=A0A0B1SCY0_OESDE|nr:hypothetical protein OESDEN_18566 [Oesophagostomum dentatum]